MEHSSKEWLEFLREQFPQGARIELREMRDDPCPIAPGSRGTLDYIDDIGTFHVRWDDGRSLGLALGADHFSVLPPEPTVMKLYMPLTARFFGRDEYGDISQEPTDELDGRGLLAYEDAIRGRMERYRGSEDAQRGLMGDYDKADGVNAKVRSARFAVEERDRQLWGVAECQVIGELTPMEKESLISYITGQASDGWGEGFEQQEIKIGDGELYVSFWNGRDWSIQTEQERFGPKQGLPDLCWSVLPGEGKLILIVKGEKGYRLSDWDTGDPLKNREIADYNNRKRGITPAQEEAMVVGSMAGWSSPGADPKVYQKQQGPRMGEMGLV